MSGTCAQISTVHGMTSPGSASYGFAPGDTRADPERIRAEASDLRALTGLLLGQGADVSAVLDQAALSFTDIVAESVLSQIGPNIAALEQAVETTEYGYGVALTWAADVEAFKVAREEQIARWVQGLATDFGVEQRIPPEQADQDMRDAFVNEFEDARKATRNVLLEILIRESARNSATLSEQAQLCGSRFREGATPANVAAVSGELGFVTPTLWPEYSAIPIPVDGDAGVADAQTSVNALDGIGPPDPVIEALERVTLLTRRAAAGAELTAAEIDYLAAYYETMGERITELPAYLRRTEFAYFALEQGVDSTGQVVEPGQPMSAPGLPASVELGLSVAAANGIMVLSRPGPGGGGYERTPSWMRQALTLEDRPTSGTVPQSPEALARLAAMGEFLGLAQVESGAGLARELAVALTVMVESVVGIEGVLPAGLDVTAGELVDSGGRGMLNVIAMNDQVSYEVITGDNMPADYDSSRFYLSIYTFEWSDEGAAAAQLTDVIPELAGDPAQSQRAQEAAVALTRILTSDAAEVRLLDGVGSSGDAASSSIGLRNPAIANALAEVFGATPELYSSRPGDGAQLSPLSAVEQERFLTYVLSDPGRATGTFAEELVAYETQLCEDYLSTGNALENGQPMYRLNETVNDALNRLALDERHDGIEAEQQRIAVRKRMFDLLTASLSLGGQGGRLLSFGVTIYDLATAPDPPSTTPPSGAEIPPLRDTSERTAAALSTLTNTLVSSGRMPEAALPAWAVDPTAPRPPSLDALNEELRIAIDAYVDVDPILGAMGAPIPVPLPVGAPSLTTD